MTRLEQLSAVYWDLYKDVYGIHPRLVNTSNWTEEQFEANLKILGALIEDQEDARLEAEEFASTDFEMRILTLLSTGAKDRQMALRWVHEAEGTGGDDEYLCHRLGLPYNYFSKTAENFA